MPCPSGEVVVGDSGVGQAKAKTKVPFVGYERLLSRFLGIGIDFDYRFRGLGHPPVIASPKTSATVITRTHTHRLH